MTKKEPLVTNEEVRNAQRRMIGEKECRICIFSSQSMLTDTEEIWYCQRRPPTVQADGTAAFPQVEHYDWCGEFIPYPANHQ